MATIIQSRFGQYTIKLKQQRTHWAYRSEQSRDERLDLLRGICVCAMIASHVPGPYPLRMIWIGAKYLLAAEGFIVIAGLLVGLLYRRIIQRNGLRTANIKMLQRAGKLYACLIVMTFIFQLFGWATQQPWAAGGTPFVPAQFLWNVVTLRVSFYMIDMILMYCLFFAFTPVCLWLLHRGYVAALLAISWSLWLLYQLPSVRPLLPLAHITTFHPFAWQIFFIHALVLGFFNEQIRRFFTERVNNIIFSVSSVCVAVLFIIYVLDVAEVVTIIGGDRDLWFDRSAVRFGRLILAVATFPFWYLATSYFWQPLRKIVGWLALPVGRDPLTSYSLHLPLIIMVQTGIALAPSFFYASPWINRVIPLMAILTVWALVQGSVALTQRTRPHTLRPVDYQDVLDTPQATS